jgi:hypothetical protein
MLAGNAYGEDEVYYCADVDSNGFYYEEKSGSYKRTGFNARKFKIKLNKASSSIEVATEDGEKNFYTCIIPTKPELMRCTWGFNVFSFNTDNGRYVYSQSYGYISDDESPLHDSLAISYGKCDKF